MRSAPQFDIRYYRKALPLLICRPRGRPTRSLTTAPRHARRYRPVGGTHASSRSGLGWCRHHDDGPCASWREWLKALHQHLRLFQVAAVCHRCVAQHLGSRHFIYDAEILRAVLRIVDADRQLLCSPRLLRGVLQLRVRKPDASMFAASAGTVCPVTLSAKRCQPEVP
jgi:hypothetical protein